MNSGLKEIEKGPFLRSSRTHVKYLDSRVGDLDGRVAKRGYSVKDAVHADARSARSFLPSIIHSSSSSLLLLFFLVFFFISNYQFMKKHMTDSREYEQK